MRILHVLHNSLPLLCGYSIRSAAIINHQRQLGLDPMVVTSAQNPNAAGTAMDVIDGVQHFRTSQYQGARLPLLREQQGMKLLRRRIEEVIAATHPDVVHAHSPVLVGLPALQAARDHGLPFVYEVRDLWENASVDRGKFRYNSPFYRVARQLETHVLTHADAVVTICDALRNELRTRVANPDRLFLVCNGVDAEAFDPLASEVAGRERWRLDGKRVIAYVGTFQPYEGLDLLIQAMPQVLASHPEAHLVIAGGSAGGPEPEIALRSLVTSMNLTPHVTLTGRLARNDVSSVYALAEVVAYPRLLTRTTALTTPLKPLEAMAMGRTVVASDVPAMRELVRDGVTGLVCRAGSVDDLAAQCVRALDDPAMARALSMQAREWVMAERQWPDLVARYHDIYREVTSITSFLPEIGARGIPSAAGQTVN